MNTDIKFYIVESLFKLLDKKDIKNIKITEIVKLSNISRTTFYNNFNNIDDVINYKFNMIIYDLYDIYKLNKLRKKDNTTLLRNVINYIYINQKIFLIIKNKLFFRFKKTLDNLFLEKIENKINYYVLSGIIINLCLCYLENNLDSNFINKIKID